MTFAEFNFVREKLDTPRGRAMIFNIQRMKKFGHDVDQLPYSIKVLLENALRFSGQVPGAAEAALALAGWPKTVGMEMPFMPYRVLLQDYTGVPLVVDLAAMRDAALKTGQDPRSVNSSVPVDLVIDHSIQVDGWSSEAAFRFNLEKEYERNSERYSLLKWAQSSFMGMRVFPPGMGICHQVNLEFLAKVVETEEQSGELRCFPDTLVGTDSHTTMVNGLGVLGWGVGGIEAEAVMLGEPYHMPIPRVLGVKLIGTLREGVTPTDLVLTVTEMIRQKNVVGAFVEYFGDGFLGLSVPDRATIANMSPEYGATVGFSPVDESTLGYLSATGRDGQQVQLVRRYCTAQGLMFERGSLEPRYSNVLEVDLDSIEPSVAGPRNPDERRSLKLLPSFARTLLDEYSRGARRTSETSGIADDGFNFVNAAGQVLTQKVVEPNTGLLNDGAVVIAAITSCTNTSNPTVMVGAGLLAKKAVELGLKPKAHVKRSLAPGSTVVTDYLQNAGLLIYFNRLGFNIVGYGCTTCIGNSGPLAAEIEKEIKARDLYAVAVLSGNRNFDGRIHPLVKGSFLMSPILVVAFALAGRIDYDFLNTPLGAGKDGNLVYLRDVWPTMREIKGAVEKSLRADIYRKRYANPLRGDERWRSLRSSTGDVYSWQEDSTYIRKPPWFEVEQMHSSRRDILGARVIALLEDKVTTDHISPAGTIAVDSPAGEYLQQHGVEMIHFSTYGSRRGNHEVLVRGGFGNIRLKNLLAPGREGGWTTHYPSGKQMSIFEAAVRYRREGTPLILLAGKMYGAGSSRDWAAKAPKLLGVRAVIAESYERIHRSNLAAMGVLPLEFEEGQNCKTLGLSGSETFDITGLSKMIKPRERVEVVARGNAVEKKFKALARIDNAVEMAYIENGGVLPFVFRKMSAKG
jgi:aconitate hydratase